MWRYILTLNMSPAVKSDCSKITAGIKISFHFRRMLLQCLNEDLQFAVCYGVAMLHWWSANCSVYIKLRITAAQNWGLAVWMYKLHYICFQGRICDFQFARYMSVYCIAALMAFSLNCASYIAQQCNVAPVTCNLWCVNFIMCYCGEVWRISFCNVQVIICDIAVQHWRLAIINVQVVLFGISEKSEEICNLHGASYII
jgi:hypothetical protein